MKSVNFILLFIIPSFLFAQGHEKHLHGQILGKEEDGKEVVLVGANVYWAGTFSGTITDEDGHFHLEKQKGSEKLVISYVGYQNDTIIVKDNEPVKVTLQASVMLDEVQVVHRQKSTVISMIDPLKTERIGKKELLKAACCNLSESFETSPSIDVSFTDAITGTRQIMLLGLAGPYTQITRESMPDIRGLSAIYGLTYIPGTWIESIQLNKGTGTVANGFESIAGQINVEIQKPNEADRMYLNVYANEEGRLETNAQFNHRFKNYWSTGLLLHGSGNSYKMDQNLDGFLDNPLGKNFMALNRWFYLNPDGLEIQAGLKTTLSDKTGGQIDFFSADEVQSDDIWGMQIKTERWEGWSKIGKIFHDKPGKSAGLQLSATSHNQESLFGLNHYNASQQSFYTNFLYQDFFINTNHQFRTGASFQYDNYTEDLNDTVFERQESVPGIFYEYTFSYLEKFNLVAGLRADLHNLFDLFFTPRIHFRYAPFERTVFRLSAGRGQRTNNIIAENSGLLASSRQIIINGNNPEYPYGLLPEVAWSYGGSFTRTFQLDYREGSFSIDFFRTDFQNQVVVDLDEDPREVSFYNLNGTSYSNSFQAQLDYEIIKRLDTRLAYRWYDVKTTYHGTLMKKPLISTHRAFLNLAYESRKYWKYDVTINWQGKKRLPNTAGNPTEFQRDNFSPAFFLINAQISKTWKEKFEVYTGVENLLNFRQRNPIIASEDPFGPYFDSSIIWGPVMGRNIYLGLRLIIK